MNWVQCSLAAAVFLLVPELSSSQVTHVVPQDFPTIQEAIDAAINGDTVLVQSGTYVENVTFAGKALTLVSQDGAAATILDGSALTAGVASGSVVRFENGEGPDSVLDGFTLTNGEGTLFESFPGFPGRRGGGVFGSGANPTIRNCRIMGNTGVTEGGGGFFTGVSGDLRLENVLVEACSAADAGGLSICGPGSATLVDCRVVSNATAGLAGGVLVGTPVVTISACEFVGNFGGGSEQGGGLAVGNALSSCPVSTPVVHVSDTMFESNTNLGGGAFGLSAIMTFERCTFRNNSGVIGAVGIEGGEASFGRCVFEGNSGNIAGVFATTINPAVVSMDRCTLVDNSSLQRILFIQGGSTFECTSSIAWENDQGDLIAGGGVATVEYSNVQGGWPGIGNISQDPLFRDTQSGNFHLSAGSPSIDAGQRTQFDPDGTVADQGAFFFVPVPGFSRGDANRDSIRDVADAIWILSYLFESGAAPPCFDSADTNDDGTIDVGDALGLFGFLFAGDPPPPAPESCGPDPSEDTLDCLVPAGC